MNSVASLVDMFEVYGLSNFAVSRSQASDQLGTPDGAKSFLRWAKIFKLCPIVLNFVQHIFRREIEILQMRLLPLLPPGYGPGWNTRCDGKLKEIFICSVCPNKEYAVTSFEKVQHSRTAITESKGKLWIINSSGTCLIISKFRSTSWNFPMVQAGYSVKKKQENTRNCPYTLKTANKPSKFLLYGKITYILRT